MKKPKKFEDITVSPDFVRELFRITHVVCLRETYIRIMCEYCSEEFTRFESGHPREDDWVNIGAKHYFNRHWLHLKPYVIEPAPVIPVPTIITTPAPSLPRVTVARGGMIYTTTTGSSSFPPGTHHGGY